jgi:predicted CopG family antitoxin
MGHKTITISEEAYKALKRAKEDYESFTDVIIKTMRRREKSNLLEYINSIGPQSELADNIEAAMKEMRKSKLRKVAI